MQILRKDGERFSNVRFQNSLLCAFCVEKDVCGLWSLIRLAAFIHLRKAHNWIKQCQFFNNNHTQLLSIEPETSISKGFKLKWHMVPWKLQMSTLLWKVSKFCRLFFIVNQSKNVFLSHAKCPFLWTSKQAYDGIGNGGLEVENIFILIKSYCAEGQLKWNELVKTSLWQHI